jgi:hypothetical protein
VKSIAQKQDRRGWLMSQERANTAPTETAFSMARPENSLKKMQAFFCFLMTHGVVVYSASKRPEENRQKRKEVC